MAGLAVATTLALTFAACAPSAQERKQTPKATNLPTAYASVAVQLINPEYEVILPADLKPYEQVAVYAKVTGFVKQLLVDRGDHVREGQLLAVLEAPEMEQRYLLDKATEQQAYNDYRYARQAYERLVDASATAGAVAAIELDRAKSAMESAQSAYDASKAGTAHSAQLQRYLRITAPFDGVITARNSSVGALAGTGAGEPLFSLSKENPLRLTVSLPEKHAASVTPGMRAAFSVSSQPGKVFEAVLSRTSGLLDRQDRSLTLEFDVDNSSGELQGGDYARVTLTLQRNRPSHWVPRKSVLNTQSGTYVMTLNGDEIRRIPVQEGIRLDTLTEVFGDLSAADNVLVKPSEEIKTGKIN